MSKQDLQLYSSIFLIIIGCVLLFMGFWTVPIGQIHNSILIATGEIFTFSGSLFGIDYHYRSRQ